MGINAIAMIGLHYNRVVVLHIKNDVAVIVWPSESESQGNSEPVSNSNPVPLE